MIEHLLPKQKPALPASGGSGAEGLVLSAVEGVASSSLVSRSNLAPGDMRRLHRLGAGRIFHCMNSVGQMWRAFDLMVERTMTREVHGGLLETKQFIQGFIADSYIDIQAARLMTVHTAEKIESGVDPRTDISAIKVFVPSAYERVVDRAIQVWGAAGVSGDLSLAAMYQGARTLRLADGPDEVHRILIAKNVLKRYHDGMGWDFGN